MHDLVKTLERAIAQESGTDAPAAKGRRVRTGRKATDTAKSVKAPKEAARKVAVKLPTAPKGKQLSYFRVQMGLTGNRTKAYGHAVLSILGMLDKKRPAVQKRAVTKFFLSDSVVLHHIDKGNLEKVDQTQVRLTESGLEFFRSRVAEGKVDRKLVQTFEAAIRKGEDCGFPLVPVTITK